MTTQLAPLIERGQRDGVFRRDVPVAWHIAVIRAIVHAASAELQSGRISRSDRRGRRCSRQRSRRSLPQEKRPSKRGPLNSGSYRPDYSPDGSKIVFCAGPSTFTRDIYVVDSDGSDLTRLTMPRPKTKGVRTVNLRQKKARRAGLSSSGGRI